MATAGTAKHALLGTWRIVETELWDLDDLDLMEPAHLTLKPNGHGSLGLLAIEAILDYRVVQREGLPAIEFSFEGSDEGDQISGRGWAILDANSFGAESLFITATTRDLRPPARKRPRVGMHLVATDPFHSRVTTS